MDDSKTLNWNSILINLDFIIFLALISQSAFSRDDCIFVRDRTEITFTVIEEKNGSDLDDFSDAGIRRSLLGKIVER